MFGLQSENNRLRDLFSLRSVRMINIDRNYAGIGDALGRYGFPPFFHLLSGAAIEINLINIEAAFQRFGKKGISINNFGQNSAQIFIGLGSRIWVDIRPEILDYQQFRAGSVFERLDSRKDSRN
jgi:hypothetical protein